MKTLGKIAIYQGTEYEFQKKTDGAMHYTRMT